MKFENIEKNIENWLQKQGVFMGDPLDRARNIKEKSRFTLDSKLFQRRKAKNSQ